MRRFLLALCAALSTAPSYADASRLRLATVELEGPVESLALDRGAFGRTQVHVGLAVGEARTLELAVASGESDDERAPALAVQPASGRARFVGWERDRARATRWSALPLGLRARPRPTVEPDGGVSVSTVLAAAFVSLAAMSLRRRPLAALAAGVLGALALVALEWKSSSRSPPAMRLFEIDGATGDALEVRAARDELEVPLGALLEFESEPEFAPLSLELSFEVDGSSRVRVAAPGANLVSVRDLGPESRLSISTNAWRDLARVWTRDGGGAWSSRGSWAVGAPLPAARPNDLSMPPSRLNPALPQGLSVLIAQCAGAGDEWVRLLGP